MKMQSQCNACQVVIFVVRKDPAGRSRCRNVDGVLMPYRQADALKRRRGAIVSVFKTVR